MSERVTALNVVSFDLDRAQVDNVFSCAACPSSNTLADLCLLSVPLAAGERNLSNASPAIFSIQLILARVRRHSCSVRNEWATARYKCCKRNPPRDALAGSAGARTASMNSDRWQRLAEIIKGSRFVGSGTGRPHGQEARADKVETSSNR